MGRISSGVGLVSGINSKDIIDQLIALESRPKDLVQAKLDGVNQQKLAYTDLTTRLASLKLTGTTLKKTSTFQAATATSSNDDVLTATAANGAAVGSYQFQVARLVTTQQLVTQGYADFNSSKIGAGTITIGQGGGELTALNPLSHLNGGAGVHRGIFRITDRSGASAVIDISSAVNLQDVIKKINTTLDVQVHAKLDGDKIVLEDVSGKTTSNLIVQDLADGSAAADLGIVANVAGNTITGTDINSLGRDTALAQLNDGRGVGTLGAGTDFTIRVGGSDVNVSLATAKTVGDAIDAINTAGTGKVKAELVAGGNGIKLTDLTGGGSIQVTSATGSTAAKDLGIEGTSASSTMSGSPLQSSLGTLLLSSLNGGTGITLGTISIQDRASGGAVDVDLSGAKTVQDVLDAINNASGLQVKASLNSSASGIQIADTSGGSGNLVISGAAATALGLVGTFDKSVDAARGANPHRQYVSANTLLSDYNGGKGVSQGSFKITTASGKTTTITLTSSQVSLGDVIKQINDRQIGVTASINANGNGILLTDTTTGSLNSLKLKVEDVTGSSASDLNIKGTAATNVIDGALEKTITTDANDTLATLQQKINDANFGATASIINDGTGLAPFRLSLTAKNSGRDGRVVFDAGQTSLNTQTLVKAQDAAVFLGGIGTDQPLLITASTNQITGAIKGVTVNLNSVSDQPVSLNITRSADAVVDQIKQFAQNFNDLVDKMADLTKFDTDTNTPGLLLGDSTVQTIQAQIYAALQAAVPTNPKYRILADVGLTLGDGAKLEFDEDKFREAYAENPDAVSTLFTTAAAAVSSTTQLTQLNDGGGVRRAPRDTDADIHLTLQDGSGADVNLAQADSLSDVIRTINNAAVGKVRAEITPEGKLKLTDLTTGTAKFALGAVNGSQALLDLGLNRSALNGVITGDKLDAVGENSAGAGIGWVLEDRVNTLIDPVTGAITRENHTLDEKTLQYQDRMSQLDQLIQAKRDRLEKQFANLESVLAGLQSQQQALGQIQSIKAPQPVSSSSSG
jgi:flagellar hook-associated protein 2